MKNRNKRITSVLAASMALGTFAPVIASVAPVFAINQVPGAVVSEENNGTYTDANGYKWNVTADVAAGEYNATLVSLENNNNVTELNLGKTVVLTSVDDEKLSIPANVTAIGNGSDSVWFSNSLTTVNINGDGVTLNKNAFANCANLSSVTLNGVTTIGSSAFVNDANLGDVTLGDGLETIGSSAFQATGLTTVNIPDSVETIGFNAFNATAIAGEVVLPSELTSIGSNAFKTSGKTLTLVYPVVDGANSKLVKTWTAPVFGAHADTNYRFVKGTSENAPAVMGADSKYYLAAPTITLSVSGGGAQNVANPSDPVSVVLGQSVTITVNKKGTLEVDGTFAHKFVSTNDSYTLTTPQLGEHTITFTDEMGVSKTVKINVVNDQTNYWVEENFNVPEWHVGADVTPSGAVAKLGTVNYIYSKTEFGTYSANKPDSEGTWWVKAVVYGNNGQNIDLQTAPKSFKVLAPLAKQGWENTAAGWTYYVDGEQVKSELITVDGRKYLIGDNGIMVKGWAKNDQTGNEWMFFDNYGCQKTGWLSNNGKWYFFNEDGVMQANEWVTDKGKSYFLTQSGGMAASRWLKKDGHDVYVDNSGALKTGWLFDSNYMAWYYLEPDTGYMATSGTVDGWTIQANGQAVQK